MIALYLLTNLLLKTKMLSANDENTPIEKEMVVWIKIGKHFINQKNIRSIARKGDSTVISLVKGEDIVVNVDYDKIKNMVHFKN